MSAGYIDIVFDGPPDVESGNWIDVEGEMGVGVSAGDWVKREDGYWALRLETTAADVPDVVDDPVNHPAHYTSDPSGVECITITRHRTFNVGSVFKYLWRAGLKADPNQSPLAKQIEDLEKAQWYLSDEIARLREQQANQ